MTRIASLRAALILAGLAPALSGCGVPDLIAHTVKVIEKSQNAPASSQQAGPAPAATPAEAAAEPPPPAAALRGGSGGGDSVPDDTPVYTPPSRAAGTPSGPITVEELPAR
ncbi:hypothetical protein [Phaeospirillum tilakii]|uniref:Lipoprotein n=1 Tax=Phaeospirillum tilakii TaxID=741673 RepID=A0ABW5C9P7_9PROT